MTTQRFTSLSQEKKKKKNLKVLEDFKAETGFLFNTFPILNL